MGEREIKINEITKIEGHANLVVEIRDNEIDRVSFGVHEGSRYFESFMMGKDYRYLPALSGRICGICTVAHEIASVKAVEDAMGIEVSEKVVSLRKLLLISSHIQSHVLHLYFLAFPDYAGSESILGIARKDKEFVKKVFKLKEATNYMTSLIGGRSVQPCTIGIGKITKDITKSTLEKYSKKMKEIYPVLEDTLKLFLSLEYPAFERKSEYAALFDGQSVPLYDGNIKTMSNEFEAKDYERHITEWVKDYSSAKHSYIDGKDYMVGALARLNLNKNLRDEVRELLKVYNVNFPNHRIAWINVAQSIECVHYALESFDIADAIREYTPTDVKISRSDGEGVGVIEAPRGLLIHHYRMKNGKCIFSNIVTPTAMNLENIERSLYEYLSEIVEEDEDVIKTEAEKIIRAYDPCISCSVHVARID